MNYKRTPLQKAIYFLRLYPPEESASELSNNIKLPVLLLENGDLPITKDILYKYAKYYNITDQEIISISRLFLLNTKQYKTKSIRKLLNEIKT